MPTAAVQAQIDAAVADALQQATAGLVVAASKPQHIDDLRRTWRKSAEHKAAQIKRFLYSMGAVIAANVMGDVVAHKDPLAHFTDLRTAWYYLIPFAYIAWKQVHPSMTASQVDSAPGVTIVPEQVAPVPDAGAVGTPVAGVVSEGDASGYALLGVIGLVLLAVGVILLVIAATHSLLSVPGLILTVVGAILYFVDGGSRGRSVL